MLKHRIIIIFSFICYWLGVIHLFYWLNRKKKRIITFHNVIPDILLPNGLRIGLIDSDEIFRMKVKEIKRFFSITTNVLESGTATITFDDGYINQSEVAGRILREEGDIPAIIFASGKMINNDNPGAALVVDLLMHWLYLAPDGEYILQYNDIEPFILNSKNRSDIWQHVIWPSFINDYRTKGYGLLKSLDALYPINKILESCSTEYLRLRLTGIMDKDIQTVKEHGWTIGWHSYEHFPLSSLPMEEMIKELSDNVPVEMKNNVFSYPYGETVSVNKDVVDVVKYLGFPCAVSNIPECNKNTFFLPRFTLADNKYLLHFELSGLKFFIRKCKLLF